MGAVRHRRAGACHEMTRRVVTDWCYCLRDHPMARKVYTDLTSTCKDRDVLVRALGSAW